MTAVQAATEATFLLPKSERIRQLKRHWDTRFFNLCVALLLLLLLESSSCWLMAPSLRHHHPHRQHSPPQRQSSRRLPRESSCTISNLGWKIWTRVGTQKMSNQQQEYEQEYRVEDLIPNTLSARNNGTKEQSPSSHYTSALLEEIGDNPADGPLCNNYHPEIWKIYEATVHEIMAKPRVLKKENVNVIERCKAFLLNPQKGHLLPPVPAAEAAAGAETSTTNKNNTASSSTTTKMSFRSALQEQETLFLQQYNFTSAEFNFATRCLVYMGDACAKQSRGGGVNNNNNISQSATITFDHARTMAILVAWRKMKETGMRPRENALSTYMYILLGAMERAAEFDNTTNPNFVNTLIEVTSWHDALYHTNEKTATLRIKSLIFKGDIAAAEQVLTSLDVQEKRLRTFIPLLEYYSNVGDATCILRLFRQMRQSPGTHLDSNSYAILLSSLARGRHFRVEATPISGLTSEHGRDLFSHNQGPNLLDDLLTEMAEDVLELSEESAEMIVDGFSKGFHQQAKPKQDGDESIQILTSKDAINRLAIGKVHIPSDSAHCPATGVKLRLLSLDETQRQHVHDTLLEMARHQSFAFLSNRKMTKRKADALNEYLNDDSRGYDELLRFSEWLDAREGDPFTAIIDGPNVAYFGHPFVHYSTLKLVVDRLEEMGEKPLVVMPHKYIQAKFRTSGPMEQHLSKRDFEVIEKLKADGKIYVVSQYCLDDYYWMLASVSNQTTARNAFDFSVPLDVNLSVPLDDNQGRFPGLRPLLVTNDQMRDHKLDLLEPREFRRWRSCHIVNYSVAGFEKDEWKEERLVDLFPADVCSREIQGNPHESQKGTVWHFPVTNWDDLSWLCLWVKR